MFHEEILSRAGDYRTGRLGENEKRSLEAHLKTCANCRTAVARWTLAEPPPGFLERVMAALPRAGETTVASIWGWRLQLIGTLAALFLIALVFWRPEQEWLDADQHFARVPGSVVVQILDRTPSVEGMP